MNGKNLSEETKWRMVEAAAEAREKAYVPYSGFAVGAALLFDDGRLVTGCNVENASYGLAICAERNAMTTAVAEGLTRPVAVAIAGPGGQSCPPCGACRQFLAEFNREMTVLLEDAGGIKTITLEELLPFGFSLKGRRE